MDEDEETEARQDGVFEFRIIVHENGDDADVGNETPRAADHVFLSQPELAWRIEAPIIDRVVVAFRQKLERPILFLVNLYDAMNDRDLPALDLEDDDFPDSDGLLSVIGEEKQIAAVESRLHGTGQNHHNRRLATSYHHQSLPDHQRRRDDHAKVEDLVVQLSLIHSTDIVEEVHRSD